MMLQSDTTLLGWHSALCAATGFTNCPLGLGQVRYTGRVQIKFVSSVAALGVQVTLIQHVPEAKEVRSIDQ
jgi:hypothetical protein